MDIQAFNNAFVYMLGYVSVDFKMGTIQCLARFHIIDTTVVYHLFIGRKWLHDHNLIPSTLHQCFKGFCKGKDIFILATKNPFKHYEASIIEVGFYDEYAGEGETFIGKPIGVPLLDLEGTRRSWTMGRSGSHYKKRMRHELIGNANVRIESFTSPNGKKVYHL